MRPKLLLLMLLLVAAVLSARPQLHDLDIRVVLRHNGDACITETRVMTIDDQGTECYIGLGTMGRSEVHDLSVSDETGTAFENVAWDVNASRDAKAGKCGLVRTRDGYELCWGLGQSGERTYITRYILTGLVRAYPDADAMRHVFLERSVTPKPQHAKITITAEDSSLVFSRDSCGIWGFRFDGDLWFERGAIVVETSEPMNSEAALYVMASFRKGLFAPDYLDEGTFAEKKQQALEGSDYFQDIPGDDDDGLMAFLLFVACFLLPLIGWVWYMIYVWRARRRVNKDLLWYRDIPLQGNLQLANNMLNAYKYFTPDYNNLMSACILKLINLQAITIETRPNHKGKLEQNFVIHPFTDLANQPVLLRKIYDIFRQAAGEDTVLEPRELKSFMRSSRNESITESFVEALHVKSSISQFRHREDEVRQVLGLKKFLKEFTLMDERHVNEVSLWKDYMVYATLFGIADQVIRDMKKINPAYFDMDQVASQMADDMTLPIIYSTMHRGAANAAMQKAAREARAQGGGGHASWGGGGGGFSGGGGGGGIR